MNCPGCSKAVPSDARFCTHCGAPITTDSTKQKVFCIHCGAENPGTARFCISCGAEMTSGVKSMPGRSTPAAAKRRRKVGKKVRKGTSARRRNYSLVFILTVVAALVGILILFKPHGESPRSNATTGEMLDIVDISLQPRVDEIASRFVCTCGKCGETPLESCTCPTAEEERRFIRRELRAGKNAEAVVLAVQEKYGGLEPSTP